MTEDQQRWIRELSKCTFLPGSFDKRFLRDMATLGAYDTLSERQAACLHRMAYRYRKQRREPRMPAPQQTIGEYTAALQVWIKGEKIKGRRRG